MKFLTTGSSELDYGQNDIARIRPLTRDLSGRISAIRWVFPVHGIPEVRSKQTKREYGMLLLEFEE